MPPANKFSSLSRKPVVKKKRKFYVSFNFLQPPLANRLRDVGDICSRLGWVGRGCCRWVRAFIWDFFKLTNTTLPLAFCSHSCCAFLLSAVGRIKRFANFQLYFSQGYSTAISVWRDVNFMQIGAKKSLSPTRCVSGGGGGGNCETWSRPPWPGVK